MSCSRTTTQWCRWGLNPPPLCLESSTLPLSHCAPSSLICGIHTKHHSVMGPLNNYTLYCIIKLVWFFSLRPSQQLWSCWDGKFTLPHFFPGQAGLSGLKPVLSAHTFAFKWQQPLNESVEGRRMAIDIISRSISMKVWGRAWICSQSEMYLQWDMLQTALEVYLYWIVNNRNKSRLLFSPAEMFKQPLWQTVWTQNRLLSSLFWVHTVCFYT